MHIEATTKLEITPSERERLEAGLSEALGSYIQGLTQRDAGKLDFSQWSQDEWRTFVSTALDVSAVGVFSMRMILVGPSVRQTNDGAPF